MEREETQKGRDEIKTPEGFSRFQWALAGFCLPILLWPLAILISPNLGKNSQLSELQINAMSIFLWIYPFVLGLSARILFKLEQRKPTVAKRLLVASAVIFYVILFYVATVGFSG